ncbi:hypothetical protein RIF29_16299 [Crotalaria pallida]|uniref:Uncharacterized protein n=1 Tax=Crotalaria pallida TaxID=3830 RepID=A0AAN9FKT9_CROPI
MYILKDKTPFEVLFAIFLNLLLPLPHQNSHTRLGAILPPISPPPKLQVIVPKLLFKLSFCAITDARAEQGKKCHYQDEFGYLPKISLLAFHIDSVGCSRSGCVWCLEEIATWWNTKIVKALILVGGGGEFGMVEE